MEEEVREEWRDMEAGDIGELGWEYWPRDTAHSAVTIRDSREIISNPPDKKCLDSLIPLKFPEAHIHSWLGRVSIWVNQEMMRAIYPIPNTIAGPDNIPNLQFKRRNITPKRVKRGV